MRTFYLLLGISLLLVGCQSSDELLKISGSTMGTTYHISYVPFHPSSKEEQLAVKKEIDKILRHVNHLMSTYQQDSEISQFNRLHSTKPFKVSPEFARVTDLAQSIAQLSGGAFDITVGPAVNLWGFGPRHRKEIPSEEQLKSLRNVVGFKNVVVNLPQSTLQKKVPGVIIDLSAIAKGYGVDAVAAYLKSIQAKAYIVEIGGEVVTYGKKFGQKWKLGITRPTDYGGGVEKIVYLSGEAMATSGDYRNFFLYDGKRFSHTIDPRTLRPVTHQLASVSVVSDRGCAYADAMATTLSVLGPRVGLEFAKRHHIAAFFIYRQGERFVEAFTPEMKPFLQ